MESSVFAIFCLLNTSRGSVCKHEVGFLFLAITCPGISWAYLQVSEKLTLSGWVVRVFQTGLYLPADSSSQHVPSPRLLSLFLLSHSFFLSAFLSFCCFSLIYNCDPRMSTGEAPQALTMPTAASVTALRTVVLLCGKQSQAMFPGMALAVSDAAQLIV